MRRWQPWLLSLLSACSQAPPAPTMQVDRMAWWREARFGLFLHWGLYALPAGAWQGKTDYGEWIRDSARIPLGEYEKFREQWNPTGFDADAWARMAKAAGMRYVVITTKHHDGFGLFDSQLTDWDVGGSPWRRDAIAELGAACRRHGLRFGLYHSIMDWHHPDYLPRRGWETDRGTDDARFSRYLDFLHGQVKELLTAYGKIDVMWFDGEWEATWNHTHGQALYHLCRSLQPDVLVNNRVDVGRAGMAGMTKGGGYVGDFGTPEQEVPAAGLPGVDWESCMTMNRHWGWNAADTAWKSPTELIRTLVDVASKGGNLLLNVGPRADGTFPELAVERLAAIGAWMDRHGESIHGTQASLFGALPWGRSTWRRDGDHTRVFLQVFDWPADGVLHVPGVGNAVTAARAGDVEITCSRDADGLRMLLPREPTDPLCPVITLDLAGEPIVYRQPELLAAAPIFTDTLHVRAKAPHADLEVRYTLDDKEPAANSPRFPDSLLLTATTTITARTFHRGAAVGPKASRTFERVAPAPPVEIANPPAGLQCDVWRGSFDVLPAVADRTADATFRVADLDERAPAAEFEARRYRGFLHVPETAVYEFALTSDDGSRLSIAGQVVVDHDGLHGAEEKTGLIALAAGVHPLTIDWFNKAGGAALQLTWAPAGGAHEPVRGRALGHTHDGRGDAR
ncbi:MAG: alpha-L-fucosidase [Planctomycetes bacterium]|nr:alpha-L-fucosidase [Planctomycetota bacterium]